MGAGVRSVKISVAAGGDVKFLKLVVQWLPPWHVVQPTSWNNSRPWAMLLAVDPAPP